MPTEAMALCTAKMNALFSQQQKFGQTCEQINKTKKIFPLFYWKHPA
jgi:hypothetical protein